MIFLPLIFHAWFVLLLPIYAAQKHVTAQAHTLESMVSRAKRNSSTQTLIFWMLRCLFLLYLSEGSARGHSIKEEFLFVVFIVKSLSIITIIILITQKHKNWPIKLLHKEIFNYSHCISTFFLINILISKFCKILSLLNISNLLLIKNKSFSHLHICCWIVILNDIGLD